MNDIMSTGFNLTAEDYGRPDTYHLIAELLKHASSMQSYMGDSHYADTSQVGFIV